MYIGIHACMSFCVYQYLYMCVCTHVGIYINKDVCVYMYDTRTYAHTYICINMLMYVCCCVMCVCMNVCMYVCTHVCMYV